MESVLRRFGLKKGEPRETEARQKLQRDLFAFSKCMEHGFPSKASAITYDPELDLMALGTRSGALRIYGGPGVELSAQHDDCAAVFHIYMFDQGSVVTICSDECLHLWEISNRDGISSLEHVQCLSFESKVKTVSASSLSCCGGELLLGAESGHVYTVDLHLFRLSDKVIYQETVIQSAPDDFRMNPGAVEAVLQHPAQPEKLLIGYNRGLIVLWDCKTNRAEQIYNAAQQLESLTFISGGKEFISSHSNGSYIVWNAASSLRPKEQADTPYGPFPCKSISKIVWKSTKTREVMRMFSGGMPRASYGDRHTVSVIHGEKHVVFDFSSKVVDFFVVCDSDRRRRLSQSMGDIAGYDDPNTLVVLTEEELMAIDLQTGGWPCYQLPYLASLHCSAITATAHVSNVPQTLWDKMSDAGQRQLVGYSTRDWPIQGGVDLLPSVGNRELLVTGHEDGSVRFWDVSSAGIRLLYKLSTSDMFGGYSRGDMSDIDADEEWPPFKKVGVYDPFSDDPRFAIHKLYLCALSEMLVVGGTAGQVIVLQFERESRQQEMRYVSMNIIGDRDNFVWKGHDALPMKGGDVQFQSGFQPLCIVQMYPPAACTALTLHSGWQLVAAGTAHGLGIVDFVQRRVIYAKCTLNPAEMSGVGESTMSRRKSFKKSLRESFRRLRSRRSDRRRKTTTHDDDSRQTASPRRVGTTIGGDGVSPRRQAGGGMTDDVDLTRPVERQVEARSADDVSGSIVRTLYFADTFLMNAQNHSATMWAGTNAGYVFIYQIHLPADNRRHADTVDCILVKEIHLKHQAPVISVCVIDRSAVPLPAPFEVEHECARPPDMSGGHVVIISSEEQLKTFTLPHLSARDKCKLTAHEGTKIRRVGFINFRSRSDGSYMESDLACLTNTGEVHVYTVPHLRRQLRADCISRENIIGIVSSVFTQNGEGFYLASPSEMVRFSVSAHVVTRPCCVVRRHAAQEPHRGPPSNPRRSSPSRTPSNHHPQSPSVAADSPHDVFPDDDSVVSGDMTADSVRVHVSEDSSVTRSATQRTSGGRQVTTHSTSSPASRTATSSSDDWVACLLADMEAIGACEFDELRIVEEGDDELMSRTTNLAASATSNNGDVTSQRPASSSVLLDSSCVVNNHSVNTPLYSSVDSIVTNEFSTRPC